MKHAVVKVPRLRRTEGVRDPRDNPDRACLGMDVEQFYPPDSPGRPGRRPSPEAQDAIAVCRPCPARGDCLDWALTHGEQGVWGATTLAERKAMRRRERRAGVGA